MNRQALIADYKARIATKPIWTYITIAIAVVIHMAISLAEQSIVTRDPAAEGISLLVLGWASGPSLASGEVWRLLTSMYLHGGLLHLIVNMVSLNAVGKLAERLYGTGLFAIIYVAAGLAGGLTSWAWSSTPTVGASGALFGTLGALVALHVRPSRQLPPGIGEALWKSLLPWLVLNVVIGLTLPNIDNAAHAGGFAGGFLVALFIGVPKMGVGLGSKSARNIAVAAALLIVGALIYLLGGQYLECGQSVQSINTCYIGRYAAAP